MLLSGLKLRIMVANLFFSAWLLFHPVHVTFTSIDYIPEMNSFKVFIKMYFDDFLRDCKLDDAEVQNKNFSSGSSNSKNKMEQYLSEKVIISVNEKKLSGKLKDMILTDNEISMNLEYITGKKLSNVTVRNLILTDLYKDQSNMVIIKIRDLEEGFKLTCDNKEQTFSLK